MSSTRQKVIALAKMYGCLLLENCTIPEQYRNEKFPYVYRLHMNAPRGYAFALNGDHSVDVMMNVTTKKEEVWKYFLKLLSYKSKSTDALKVCAAVECSICIGDTFDSIHLNCGGERIA
jgi:hypothetical protein